MDKALTDDTGLSPLDTHVFETYPEWLALPYEQYITAYRELSARSYAPPSEWQVLLLRQSGWIQLWLRYLLLAQASGRWLARQPLEEWQAFPGCCQPGSSLYLLAQAVEQICRLEQKGALPFRQMHQWLCKHQTGWGLLLNQLIELLSAGAPNLSEGVRYNHERLGELLKNADFMAAHEVYGVLAPEPGTERAEPLGVRYRGRAVKGSLAGGLPEPGCLFLEDPRTGTRFQLPFYRLCPQCQAKDRFTPIVWQRRSLEHGLRFVGCEHAPVYYPDSDAGSLGAASAYVRFSAKAWQDGPEDNSHESGDPETRPTWPPHVPSPVKACVVHSELLVDALMTLKNPQQLITTYDRLLRDLLDWVEFEPDHPEKLSAHLSGQDADLIFSERPEKGLAFALALHQRINDYNRQQSLPSSHLQVRSGLAFGPVQLAVEHERSRGGALREARRLAAMGLEGQLLASDAVQENFSGLSPDHARLFGRVGSQDKSDVYTLYTRGAGTPNLPEGFSDPPTEPLPPSPIETAALLTGLPPLPVLPGLATEPAAALIVSETPVRNEPLDVKAAFARRPRVLQNHLGMSLRLIYPGRFMMGSAASEPGRLDDETQHLVVLSRGFYLMTTPVIQKQWELVMGANPSFFRHPERPVENVSWDDVQIFLTRLNQSGSDVYRLPTEAEWEYSCRAGSSSAFCYGHQPPLLADYAWYGDNSAEGYPCKQSHPVATRRPNRWGLYDMHGNIWEWVADWYAQPGGEMAKDPSGPLQGLARVIKGGRWNSQAANCRSASRSQLEPDQTQPGSLGFRLVLEAE